MKKTLTSLLFCFILFFLISCNGEQQLLKKVDGRWKIESIRFYGDDERDSTAIFKNSYLYFERCTNPDNRVPFCNGYHQFDSGERFEFVFQVRNYRNPQSEDVLNITYRDIDDRIAKWWGGYTIKHLDEHSMILFSDFCYRVEGHPRRCNYSEIRLSRE